MRCRNAVPCPDRGDASSGSNRGRGSGSALVALIAFLLAASLGPVARCHAGGLVIEAPNVTGLAPGSSGSFDIVLVNTNTAGGTSYDVSTDSLDVSIVGPAGITITGVTTSTTSQYIFAASISNDYGRRSRRSTARARASPPATRRTSSGATRATRW